MQKVLCLGGVVGLAARLVCRLASGWKEKRPPKLFYRRQGQNLLSGDTWSQRQKKMPLLLVVIFFLWSDLVKIRERQIDPPDPFVRGVVSNITSRIFDRLVPRTARN